MGGSGGVNNKKKITEVKLHFMANSVAKDLITLSQMCNTGAAFVSF